MLGHIVFMACSSGQVADFTEQKVREETVWSLMRQVSSTAPLCYRAIVPLCHWNHASTVSVYVAPLQFGMNKQLTYGNAVFSCCCIRISFPMHHPLILPSQRMTLACFMTLAFFRRVDASRLACALDMAGLFWARVKTRMSVQSCYGPVHE